MRSFLVIVLFFSVLTLSIRQGASAAEPAPAPAAPPTAVIPELNKPVTVQFLATPLGKALDTLAGYVPVPFVVDKNNLQLDAPVTLDIKNLPLQTVLIQMRKLGLLDFEFREGIVFVTSKNELFRQRMVTRVYDVRALTSTVPDFNDDPEVQLTSVSGSTTGGGNCLFNSAAPTAVDVAGETVDEIANLIKGTVEKNSWKEARRGEGGGPATISKRGHLLVVTTVPEVQKEIADLLAEMHKAYGKTISIEGRFLLMKTAALDKLIADKGKGTLVLDAKAADELLAAADKGEGSPQIVGTARTVCFNGQQVWLTAGAEDAYLANMTPVVAEGVNALSPTISSIVKGATLNIIPTVGWNDEWISIVVRTYVTRHVELKELHTTLLVQATTQPDKYPTAANNISGIGKPPILADSVKSTLQLPTVEGLRTKTMVKVSSGGAVLLSGASGDTRQRIGEDREIVLMLRATANK